MSNEIYNYEPLWGSWKIDELIGTGSVGNVYKVSKTVMDKEYVSAVKFMTVPTTEQFDNLVSSNSEMEKSITEEYFNTVVNSIIKEVDLLYKLKGHTNIISYEDHMVKKVENSNKWHIIIRMEFSKSLKDHLKENTLSEQEIIKIGTDMCEALNTCHGSGILHRDIKEANIFRSDSGHYKIGDFSVSRDIDDSTHAQTRVGTINYMPPEIMNGRPYNRSADIYSLGIVLYKLLNKGRMPFMPYFPEKFSPTDVQNAQVQRLSGKLFNRPSMGSNELIRIVLKACSFRAEDRYQSAEEMKRELMKLYDMTTTGFTEIMPEDRTVFAGSGGQVQQNTATYIGQNPMQNNQQANNWGNNYNGNAQQMNAQPNNMRPTNTPPVNPNVNSNTQMNNNNPQMNNNAQRMATSQMQNTNPSMQFNTQSGGGNSKSKSLKIIIAVIAGVVILGMIGVAVLAYVIWGPKGKPKDPVSALKSSPTASKNPGTSAENVSNTEGTTVESISTKAVYKIKDKINLHNVVYTVNSAEKSTSMKEKDAIDIMISVKIENKTGREISTPRRMMLFSDKGSVYTYPNTSNTTSKIKANASLEIKYQFEEVKSTDKNLQFEVMENYALSQYEVARVDLNLNKDSASKATVYKLGAKAEYNKTTHIANSIKKDEGNDYKKPADGNIFYAVSVTVDATNRTDTVSYYDDDYRLVDSDGYRYVGTYVTYTYDDIGSVKKGEKKTGYVCFEVPKSKKGFKLEILAEEDYDKSNVLTFDLGQ